MKQKNIRLDTIEKNTLLLFVRMTVLMLISVVSVRFVRSQMGIEGYGVYTALTGLVQMLICFNAVLAAASQRFFSVAIGTGDRQALRSAFAVSRRLCRWLSLFIFVAFETVGLWFVNQKMQYPPEQSAAVVVTYQLTLLAFLVNIIQIPWLAAVMAHEKMNVYTCASILEAVLKLGLALLLPFIPYNALVVYSAGLFAFSGITTAIYIRYGRSHFSETQSTMEECDTNLTRQMAQFGGWSLFGNIAGMLMLQGNLLLLNVYRGPIVNADFAIALQVFGAFVVLGNNVIFAVRPQMTMAYASNDYPKLNRLFLHSSIAVFGLMLLVAVPLTVWMPQVLTLWLGDTTPLMVTLCRLMIVNILIQIIGNQFTIVMQASGKVKEYHLVVETMSLLCFPLSWLFLHLGYSPETTVWIMIVCMAIAHGLRIERVRRYYPVFPLTQYLVYNLLPIGVILAGFIIYNLR